jgi:hypothetical protein
LPFASAAASALKRASYGCALPTTNHTEPLFVSCRGSLDFSRIDQERLQGGNEKEPGYFKVCNEVCFPGRISAISTTTLKLETSS